MATIGSYGAPDIKTPNIDSLARDGVRLTDFYAKAPNCSPTRAGLISGRYQQRFGLEAPLGARGSIGLGTRPAGDRVLAAAAAEEQRLRDGARRQVASRLQARVQPEAHGFDYFFGFKSGFIDYYQHTAGPTR